MSIIDDNGFRIIPKVDIKPVENPTESSVQNPVQDNNAAKKYDSIFSGNFFKAKLDLKLTGDNLPTQTGNFVSALFDDGSVLKLDKNQQPIYQYDSKMSGKDAAKAILSQDNPTAGSLSDARDTQPKFYTDALKDHKNDPQWMADFYKSLGPEKTAKLIDQTLTTSTFQYSKPEEVRAALANIRDSLSGMASTKPPLFEQKDMDALVKAFVKDSNGQGIYDLVPLEIFGKMDYKSEGLKTMFFKSASQIALSGELGNRQSQDLAAAASHVLSQTSANNQAEQLSALRGDAPAGSISNLSKFITLAMHGPTETPSLESRLGTLSQYPGDHGPAAPEPYGKVDSLIFNAAYSGYTDGFAHGPNLSSDQMKALRTELFQSATTNLANGCEGTYSNSTFMKDGLSEIYMQDFNSIYKSGLGENGSGLNSTLSKGLTEFFKYTVFTNSPGNLHSSLMNFVKTQVQGMAQALNSNDPNAEKAFQEKFGGLTRLDGAALLGNLLGTMKQGLNEHISEINDNAEAKKEALGFLFDITVGLIPGAGGKLSEGATNTAYKLLGQVIDKSQDKIMDSIKSGALDKAKEYFVEANTDKNPMDLLDNLKEGVNMSLPDGDNGTGIYHQTFQSSYNYTLNN